jgi:lipopolysaccharide transport system ATP-binding protein
MNYALRCENISKKYKIGGRQKSYRTLSETITGWLPRLFDRRAKQETFWALKDVSLDVERGEIIGIIGRNGAGKTTLLRIIANVTKPTLGQVTVLGKVGSMLEVGTGFHGELTGRENIMLSGAILGMKRSEILSKFDEIVAFSELDQFVDTPVKRYSSGMYLRLGFSVASHLDTDVMLVDEVLAVGDSGFQQRCMEKIKSITQSGRTVLFVSHNMTAIANLCNRCIVLDEGQVKMIGSTETAIEYYMQQRLGRSRMPLTERKDRSGDGRLIFADCLFETNDGTVLESVLSGQSVIIHLALRKRIPEPVRDVAVVISIYTAQGQIVTSLWTEYNKFRFDCNEEFTHVYCRIPRLPLTPGRYSMRLGMASGNQPLDWLDDAAGISVVAGDYFGAGLLARPEKLGLLFIDHQWETSGNRNNLLTGSMTRRQTS